MRLGPEPVLLLAVELVLLDRVSQRAGSRATDDALLIDGLLRRGILIRPGAEMGMPGWARITVGPRPLMELVAEALPAVRAELAAGAAR